MIRGTAGFPPLWEARDPVGPPGILCSSQGCGHGPPPGTGGLPALRVPESLSRAEIARCAGPSPTPLAREPPSAGSGAASPSLSPVPQPPSLCRADVEADGQEWSPACGCHGRCGHRPPWSPVFVIFKSQPVGTYFFFTSTHVQTGAEVHKATYTRPVRRTQIFSFTSGLLGLFSFFKKLTDTHHPSRESRPTGQKTVLCTVSLTPGAASLPALPPAGHRLRSSRPVISSRLPQGDFK